MEDKGVHLRNKHLLFQCEDPVGQEVVAEVVDQEVWNELLLSIKSS